MSDQFAEILERRKKGSLKIYLGYAAGVGKTFAMLQEAHRLKIRGFDVVIGYLEPHRRLETLEQVGELEVIAKRSFTIGAHSYEDMDLEAIKARRPQIALIDELAHSNAPDAKNKKRYQDILELLDQEINIISTMNVQHLESVADKLSSVIGTEVRERVPDLILGRADQIVTVDVSIEELRDRLRTGKIYPAPQAETALVHFFTHSNLSMLRETALREAAGDQERRIEEEHLLSQQSAQVFHETIMVCLSSDPKQSAILIRKGAKMASQLSARCFVVYVRRKAESPIKIDASLQRKIQNNLLLAQQLGCEPITLTGENVSECLVNFAIEHNIKHAVFEKSRISPLRERLLGSVILDFSYDALGVDIHILSTVEAAP